MADASRLAASGHRPTALTVGSLFAGIGGFDLAARWMGWRTAWFSEIDPYASAVLAKHWPDVPNHGDITRIDFTTVEPVDVLCGGFPCQDISNAGKREGIDGKRSGLWSHYARAIRDLRPRYVVVENVAALLTRGLERVLGDLAEIGYDAEWAVLSAADVGAPHLRERLWIVAYPDADGTGRRVVGPVDDARREVAHAQPLLGDLDRFRAAVADAEGQPQRAGLRAHEPRGIGRGRFGDGGSSPHTWAVEPDVGRVADGIPRRVDRLRGLGNAIVPACVLPFFQAIQAAEDRRMREMLDDAA